MKEQIPLESLKRVFQEQIDVVRPQTNLNPKVVLFATKQFFNQYEVKGLDKGSADNDMLLFQYGSYNFENQKEFYLDITRQFKIEDDQDEYYQLSSTLFYDLRGFERIKSYNLWSTAFSDLTVWSEAIVHTESFLKAMESKISFYRIELNTT